MKSLVAIAPNGAFIFVSELYTGSISDQDLFIQSGIDDLLRKVPDGKSLMVDRGFEIEDLILKHGILLNVPPFKGKQRSLPWENVQKTQGIARLRIHIERAIQQIKLFGILKCLLLSLQCVSGMICKVCAFLANFQRPVIADLVGLWIGNNFFQFS